MEFLDHRDGVVEAGLGCARDLARAIRRHRPDVLVLSNYDAAVGCSVALNMADHRVVGLAALDAARDAGNRWVFPELLDEGLEPWPGVRFAAVNASPRHRRTSSTSPRTMDRGSPRCASTARTSRGWPTTTDPDAFLRGNAASAGATVRRGYAVEFELVDL